MTSFTELSDQADAAFGDGDIEQARQLYQSLCQTHPQSPAGLKGLMAIATENDDWPAALQIGAEGREKFPSHSWWRAGYGKALVGSNKTDDAIAFFQDLIDQTPESASGYSGLIPIFAQAERWSEVSELCMVGLRNFPEHKWWRGWGLSSFERQRDYEGADSFLQRLLEIDPTSSQALLGASRIAASKRDWAASLRYAERGLAAHPNDEWFARRALSALIELDEFATARELLASISLDTTGSLRLVAELEMAAGNTHQALAAWDEAAGLANRDVDVRFARADAYRLALLHDRSSDLFETIIADHPEHSKAWVGYARTASDRRFIDLAVERWSRAFDHFPDNEEIANGLYYSLLAATEYDEALRLIEARLDASTTPTQRARLLIVKADYFRSAMDFDGARAIYDEVLRSTDDANARETATRERGDLALRAQEDADLITDAINRLSQLESREARSTEILAKLEIARGTPDNAPALIDAVPMHSNYNPAGLWLRAWQATYDGDHDRAAELGRRALKRKFIPHVHAAIEQLDHLRSPVTIKDGDVVLFTACRDETARIGDFLRHHRGLGVDVFVVVDNGSVDGTREFLLEQPDVITYLTHDDYVTSGSSMRWINELIERMSTTNWCLYVDVDELLVYPDSESRPVQAVTEYLDKHGFNAVPGYMIDMHADTLGGGYDYRAGDSMLETCPYFTNTYDFQPFYMSPYTDVRGGFRTTVLGIKYLQMTKTPFVRSDSGVKFLLSSHETTPSIISDLSCALLHFKYIGESVERAVKEAQWTPHSYYGNNTRMYTQHFDERGPGSSTKTPWRVRYQNSDQLIAMGLLRRPDEWA